MFWLGAERLGSKSLSLFALACFELQQMLYHLNQYLKFYEWEFQWYGHKLSCLLVHNVKTCLGSPCSLSKVTVLFGVRCYLSSNNYAVCIRVCYRMNSPYFSIKGCGWIYLSQFTRFAITCFVWRRFSLNGIPWSRTCKKIPIFQFKSNYLLSQCFLVLSFKKSLSHLHKGCSKVGDYTLWWNLCKSSPSKCRGDLLSVLAVFPYGLGFCFLLTSCRQDFH